MHVLLFFFFNDTATTEIYTLSLHDALPIFAPRIAGPARADTDRKARGDVEGITGGQHYRRQGGSGSAAPRRAGDRKSTRLNSSHSQISYAVFCLKKKKKHNTSVYADVHGSS